MVVGVAVGPFGLALLADHIPLLATITLNRPESIAPIAELGISMMMFVIGLELSLERLRVMRRLVFGLGLLQFVLCAVAVGGIAMALGASPVLAAVTGTALAMSSTAVVVQVLSHEKRLGGPVGRTSLAVLLLQDIAAVPVMFVISVAGASGGTLLLGNRAGGRRRDRPHHRRTPRAAPAVPQRRANRKPRAVRRCLSTGRARHRTRDRRRRVADGTRLPDRRSAAGRNRIPPPDRGDYRPVQRPAARCVPDLRWYEPQCGLRRCRHSQRRGRQHHPGRCEAGDHRMPRARVRTAVADRPAGWFAAGSWR